MPAERSLQSSAVRLQEAEESSEEKSSKDFRSDKLHILTHLYIKTFSGLTYFINNDQTNFP